MPGKIYFSITPLSITLFLVSCLVNWYMMERKENTKCRFRGSIHFIQKILTCLTAEKAEIHTIRYFLSMIICFKVKTISSRKNKLFVDMKSAREKDRRLGCPGLCSKPQDTGYWRCKEFLIKYNILIKCLQPRSSDLSWRPLSWLSARWCTPAPSGSLCSSPPECVTKLIWTNFNTILTFEPQSSSLPHSSSCFMGGILRLRRNGPQV